MPPLPAPPLPGRSTAGRDADGAGERAGAGAGATGWTVLVPIKPLADAKTRLRGAVDADLHADLVLAMARDTVAAALACPDVATVAVVTGEPAVAAAVGAQGAVVVPEPAAPDAARTAGGLNAALAHGAAAVGDGWVAAMPADLPALRPAELAAALRTARAAGRPGYVADADGTGTVLLTAVPGTSLRPRFGPGSAEAHARGGAATFGGDWPSLRRDVDTPDDLGAAAALGLGEHTAFLMNAVR
ncbi:2-phospho-L-lactate guanylyltransferase [Virgisporangium aliadipatigenens]|uniref:Phosphoenolpyruvate guanylyltransferase n=1 Tax=Virgisporangium aliadipatigenens TaxID=741659 RepID=A0A8J3YIK4_9ACTN|nr:2-phospho-L-lactate guanylyltransferase [Virgisporangium aliadipatigenens]GIJ45736.1 2-phospho-L-lactate guanylyltransferase [Virgisporangium aliadipatigenens]